MDLKEQILKLITEEPGMNMSAIWTRIGRHHPMSGVSLAIQSLIYEGKVQALVSTQNIRHGRKSPDFYPVEQSDE